MPFEIHVVRAEDAPLVMAVRREVDHADRDDLRAHGMRMEAYAPGPTQAVDIRSHEGLVLRPMMTPGGLTQVDVRTNDAVTDLARSIERRRRAEGALGDMGWHHYPMRTAGSRRSWAHRDRSEIRLTRVEVDGREVAIAEAARSLTGARIVDDVIWLEATLPVVAMRFRPGQDGRDVRSEEVRILGYDTSLGNSPVAVRNLREDEAGKGWDVSCHGIVERPNLDLTNVGLMSSRMQSLLRNWEFSTTDPEVRHALATIDLLLDRGLRRALGAAETLDQVRGAVERIVTLAPGNERVGMIAKAHADWEAVALPEHRREAQASLDLDVESDLRCLML